MQLSDIAIFVDQSIRSSDICLSDYVTTDSLLQNREGRTMATNLPPTPCNLTLYQPGDILMANIRPYLKKVWMADTTGGCSADVLVFRAKENVSSKYLYSVLIQDSFFDYVMLAPKGSKMPRGDKNHIMRFPIYDLADEANKVGELMWKIEAKLANNRKQNVILEKMAKQIYNYWFVQFDFPDENGRPYKSSGGKMVWNETLKREIPEGWEVMKIGDICPAEKGSLITKKDAVPGHIKVVAAGLDFSYYHNASNRPANTITVSGSGENAGFTRLWREEIFASDCSTIVHNNIVDVYITYYTLKSYGPWLYRIARKSAQPHIYPADVNGLSRIVPPVYVIDKIESNFHSINSQIALLQTESEDLQSLRSYLLPLLMTGQAKL